MYPLMLLDGEVVVTPLDNLTTVLSSIWNGIVGNGTTTHGLLGTITSNALLLIPVAGVFAALVIGLTMKLMGTRRRGRR